MTQRGGKMPRVGRGAVQIGCARFLLLVRPTSNEARKTANGQEGVEEDPRTAAIRRASQAPRTNGTHNVSGTGKNIPKSEKEMDMKATRMLGTGALAISITLGGLAVQGHAAGQPGTAADPHKSVQGAEHKCGSGNCGAGNCGTAKPEDGTEKKDAEKQAREKNSSSKGATHSCGAGTCG